METNENEGTRMARNKNEGKRRVNAKGNLNSLTRMKTKEKLNEKDEVPGPPSCLTLRNDPSSSFVDPSCSFINPSGPFVFLGVQLSDSFLYSS
jgi:hypothetical protein